MKNKNALLQGAIIGIIGFFGLIVVTNARLDNPLPDSIWSRSGTTITSVTAGDTLSVSNLQVAVLSTITTQMTTGTLTVSTTADQAFRVKAADPSGLDVFAVDTNGAGNATVSGTLNVGNGTNEIQLSYSGGGIIATDSGILQINPNTVLVNFGGTTTGFPLIRSAAGSNSAASFSFVGDQDTGLYRQAADSAAITAGSEEMVRFIEDDTQDVVRVNPNGASGNNIDFEVYDTAGTSIFLIDAATRQGRFGATFYSTSEITIGNTTSTTNVNWRSGNRQNATLDVAATIFTFVAPGGPAGLTFRVIQDEGGSRTVTWPATVNWSGGTAPTLSTTAGAVDIVAFYFDGSEYNGSILLDVR